GEQSEAATAPTPEAMAEYQKFNEDLVKAGVVLEAGRLHPSSQGKRVRFDGKKRTVIDGPFAETKELVAGYWLWQVRSMDEALEQWPAEGVPERPGAWLMGTAKHRAIDLLRRRKALERKHEELGRDVERAKEAVDFDSTIDDEVGDDLLGLIFMACHPVLSKDARVALTLRVLGGLTTEEIARAFLVPVSTIAQRIVRAKRTLAEAHVRFEVASGAERDARLASVLEVIYLIFNEGY